jgi:PAS domain S-box-containing protein
LDTDSDGNFSEGASLLSSQEQPPQEFVVPAPRELLFAEAFDSAPHAMALLSADGRILQANRLLCRMLGFRKPELTDLNIADITHPEDLATDTEQRYRLARSDIGRYELVLRYVRRNRETIWVRTSVAATRRLPGFPLHFVAEIESITSRKIEESADLPEVSLSRFNDATLSAIHEIGNCLTPLMMNSEMIVEQAPRGDVGDLAKQIFKAARRIAFALRRLRPVDDPRPVAYVDQDRIPDLRIVAPPRDDEAPVERDLPVA